MTTGEQLAKHLEHRAAQRGEGTDAKKFWTRVGVAFENRDGSWNHRFDYFPANHATTVQLRDIEEREDRRSA